MLQRVFVVLLVAIICAVTASEGLNTQNSKVQIVNAETLKNIQDHKQDAQRIIDLVTKGAAKGQTYNRLATMADTFGPRLSGSDQLEQSIDWVLAQMKAEGLENVHGETAMVPRWVRGNEYAELIQPQGKKLAMLGLGNSVGTPKEGITAEVLVVSSFDELKEKAKLNQTAGRIIVYNQYCDWSKDPISCYGRTVGYRGGGATAASRVGAVASLTRSVAAFSIDSPHTGEMGYDKDVKPIPAACITIEDAEMMARMQARGQKIVIKLYMEARTEAPRASRNVIAEIKGSTYPDEVVVVSGHIDSWDVGQGAMDDGGGAFISWEVLSLLKMLNLRPKRTIRAIMWTCEEFGGIGAQQYYDDHKANVSKFDLVMESDLGTFKPLGIQFTGSDSARAIMKSIGTLLAPINASLVTTGGEGTDIGLWIQAGVPGASLANENSKYFWFHHSQGDMMTVLNSGDLDLCAATWAVTAFVVADLDQMLPRK